MCYTIVGDDMTKDIVLAILKKAGSYVSGEEISRTLGISRAAVNSAIKTLRNDGYDILSSTNKGYVLNNVPDRLNIGEMLALLPADRVEHIICLDSIDSTNNCLRELAQKGAPDGQIIIANEQTEGRGRHGRSFASPRDKGVYLSMLMRPGSLPADIFSITAWVAVAICNAIETVCGIRPGIKWVNDLVVNKKKVCGILTEMSVEGESGHVQYVIVGIGLNVNEQANDFSEEITQIATSLYEETGQNTCRARLACEMVKELDKVRSRWPIGKQEYLDAYRNDCITSGKEICIQVGGTERIALVEGIDDSFGLIARFADGSTESITSGEASVRGLYGYV